MMLLHDLYSMRAELQLAANDIREEIGRDPSKSNLRDELTKVYERIDIVTAWIRDAEDEQGG